ncbi:glycosyltransferase family 2 protein [Megamonas funiformis]|jgi:glycosyltransferase involved in cell wall biosynthesis|uniref:glycosyltransferase family 2 protein n=1 Tax=Megamonas funiformis TaxID=437897 RepID=UPI0022E23AB7|nr:glycosyltransferase family 2 protein [Megamonas funiformis]
MGLLLSIIIPIYNVEDYIKECLDSISKQKTKNEVEIICIDDGSTDKSGIICDEYAELDKRFRVIHQENKGVSYTRNLGVEMSKGKYLAWIDPDDYIDKDWWISIKYLINKNIDMIFFDYSILKNKKYIDKCFSDKSGFIDKNLFINEIVIDRRIQNQLWQKVFKKSLIKDIKFPEDVSLMEDYAVLHKIALRAKNIYYLSKKLYFYRVRNDSIVTSLSVEKNYKAYLIAKNRYKYLYDRNIKTSKIGYLVRALNVCAQYYKVPKKDKDKNRKKYIECKKVLKENKKYIWKYEDCDIGVKIRFLLDEYGLLRLCIYLKSLINNIFFYSYIKK